MAWKGGCAFTLDSGNDTWKSTLPGPHGHGKRQVPNGNDGGVVAWDIEAAGTLSMDGELPNRHIRGSHPHRDNNHLRSNQDCISHRPHSLVAEVDNNTSLLQHSTVSLVLPFSIVLVKRCRRQIFNPFKEFGATVARSRRKEYNSHPFALY